MTRERRIWHVDAFTATPLEGNPAAVVEGEGLSADTMQRIALNQRLSETVFLLPPTDAAHSAHIRIFTPGTELPFAGHPTVAAAHILSTERNVRTAHGAPLLIEMQAGVIPVEVSQENGAPRYTMTQVTPEFRESDIAIGTIAASIGLESRDVLRAEFVSTGVAWLIAQIASLEAMMRVRPDMTALMNVPMGISIFCVSAQCADAQVHVRSFAPSVGVTEDPVTGSSNGCIAALIGRDGLLPTHDGKIEYIAEQGLEMGQPGRIFASVTDASGALSVRIGGAAVTVLRGTLLLPD